MTEKCKTMELLANELNPERLRMWVLQSTKNLIELFHCPLSIYIYITHRCACALLLHEGQIWLIKFGFEFWLWLWTNGYKLWGNEFTHQAAELSNRPILYPCESPNQPTNQPYLPPVHNHHKFQPNSYISISHKIITIQPPRLSFLFSPV